MRGSRESWGVFDLPDKERHIALIEKECADPSFWGDQRRAKRRLRELSELKTEVSAWRGLENDADNIIDLAQMALEESDESIHSSLQEDLAGLEQRLRKLEFAAQLSGQYDDRGAIIAIKQGAGGVEAQDWVQVLLRMYTRWAERRGYGATVLEATPGDEAGLKSATLEVDGRYAYGYLRSERGVHRLVRLSPFDSDHQRHTTFALVEVLPEADEAEDISINPDDVTMDTFRASGHGGQNVQKNSTAVRLTHEPTGLVVSVQNERSQAQNKDIAMSILYARLVDMEMQRRSEERAKLRGDHVSAEWGRQVRSYVLHPYQLVKDHRTGHETSDTEGVLDGEIQPLLEAYLLTTMNEDGGA